jgi:PleD family two-component response regulator
MIVIFFVFRRPTFDQKSSDLIFLKMIVKNKAPREKTVFVVESETSRQKEMSESMSHQSHWNFVFFDDAAECLEEVKKSRPLAVFLDIQHFDKIHDEKYGFELIQRFKVQSPETEILVFSENDNEEWAAKSLKEGAMDYIILNEHQYIKMEYELQWLENVKDRQSEDKKFIRLLIVAVIGLIIFIISMTILYELGYLKEGTETELLLGV